MFILHPNSIEHKMADQEVIKHTKKVFGIWNNNHSFWEKVKEFFLEIFIIVFAISVSVGLHDWSEHRKEQAEVKEFLLGLKTDLEEDIGEVRGIIVADKSYDTAYRYLSRLRREVKPDKDSLHRFIQVLGSNIYLRPNKSRFQGFLSSGKILNIKPDSLANEILFLYQEAIPQIQSSEGGFLYTQNKLDEYLIDNLKGTETDLSKWEVLATPKGNYLCRHLIPHPQLYERYEQFIHKGEGIIKQIDSQYSER
jgi:hypothetical protein